MSNLIIFDPAMCCSTGICGPGVDKELLRVATVLNKLKNNKIPFERYNLSQNPGAFVQYKIINDILNTEGPNVLPVTVLDRKVVKKGAYLTNEEFCQYLNLPQNFFQNVSQDTSGGCCGGGKCC